jgi:5-aminopentanamidase
VRHHAFDLGSGRFLLAAARLADAKPTLVDVVERSGSSVHNSAVVLEHRQFKGVYRKTHLLPGEALPCA